MNTQCLDLDLHRLDLRFVGARVAEPRAVERIARSIERGGQLVPCIAVVDPPVEVLKGDERLVLIDGYRRIAALRRLGRDTARVEQLDEPLQQHAGLSALGGDVHLADFLAVVYLAYRLSPFRWQNRMLLVAGYLLDVRFLFLIACSTTVDFSIGLLLADKYMSTRQRLTASLFLAAAALFFLCPNCRFLRNQPNLAPARASAASQSRYFWVRNGSDQISRMAGEPKISRKIRLSMALVGMGEPFRSCSARASGCG
jgi:ParB-like nuclease domain